MNQNERPLSGNNVVKKIRCALILLGAPMLTACVYIKHRPFPTDWENPGPVAKDTCADINGNFNVHGDDWTGKPMQTNPLDMIFWSRFERRAWPASKFTFTHVAIKQAAGVLKVSVWETDTLIAQKDLRKGESNGYRCTTEGIEVGGQNVPPENILGYIGESHTLFKFSDGGLGVKSESTGGGLALASGI